MVSVASLAEQISALGAVKLRDAATARGIHPDTLYEWARRGIGKSPFRGPRGIMCVRESELDAELEHFRCDWDGCPEYALLSKSGKCKVHDAAVPRQGKLTAQEFANKHPVNLNALVVKLENGEVPGEKADRRGRRPGGWLLDEEEALAALDGFRCRWWKGCTNYALGESRHCPDHAGAAAAEGWAKGKVALPPCKKCGSVYENYPSQHQRKGELCRECNLESEEFARKRDAARAETQRARKATVQEKRDEGLVPLREDVVEQMHLAAGSSYPYHLASLGLLEVEEAYTGAFKQLFTKPESVVDVGRFQAKREKKDGRMAAALKPEVQVRRIEGLAGRELSHRETEEVMSRIRQRRTAIRKYNRGRPERATPPKHHVQWEARWKEIQSWYASQVVSGDVAEMPSTWAMIEEAAREFGVSPTTFYMALYRL